MLFGNSSVSSVNVRQGTGANGRRRSQKRIKCADLLLSRTQFVKSFPPIGNVTRNRFPSLLKLEESLRTQELPPHPTPNPRLRTSGHQTCEAGGRHPVGIDRDEYAYHIPNPGTHA